MLHHSELKLSMILPEVSRLAELFNYCLHFIKKKIYIFILGKVLFCAFSTTSSHIRKTTSLLSIYYSIHTSLPKLSLISISIYTDSRNLSISFSSEILLLTAGEAEGGTS